MKVVVVFAICGAAMVLGGCNAPAAPPERELPAASDLPACKFVQKSSDGSESVLGSIYFISHFAIETSTAQGAHDVVFDLEEMSWTVPATGERKTLAECREWTKNLADEIRKKLAASKDDRAKTLFRRMLEPGFTTTRDGDTLVIKNEIVSYTARDPLRPSEATIANYFRFDQLSTYRKCMQSGQQLPYMGLEAASQMWRHDFLPGSLSIHITPPGGEPISMGTAIEFVRSISQGEEKRLSDNLKAAQSISKSPATPAENAPPASGKKASPSDAAGPSSEAAQK
jgi:hypothetical protein